MKRFPLLLVAMPLAFVSAETPAPLPDLSAAQVLRLAEAASPDLKAAVERKRAAEQNVRIFQSFYYPSFDLEAIDSFGFPGSSRDLGISGLMGSPYRSGPAGGMTANLDLYDAGRRWGVETARKQLDAIKARTNIVRYQVDQLALEIYLDASRFRGQQEASKDVAKEIAAVEKEVNHYVITGQRSVVERLLVHDQTIDAEMTSASFGARYSVALQRLGVVTASSSTALSCPSPQMVPEDALGLIHDGYSSPLLAQAEAEAAAAHAAVFRYSAENYPKLVATASVGDMDQSRLVPEKNYSGGFGFTLPLFEGYRIQATVQQARALASARDNDQLSVQMDIDQLNAHYDETIESSRVKLDYLQKELEEAHKAFKLAKERYFSFQGTLVDVREALRNVARTQAELIDVKTDLLLAVGSRALLNGAKVQ